MKRLAQLSVYAALVLPAQGWGQTVYESKDKSGAAVFSDRPTPGAKAVDLPPPNVIQTPALPKRAPAPAAAPTPYTSLAISSLENEGTVHTNTGEFQIAVRSVPALRAGSGDRIRVTLDGTQLSRRYSSGAITIRTDDWQSAAKEDAQHTLQVAIVNGAGATLIESAPIKFYAHRATALRKKAR